MNVTLCGKYFADVIKNLDTDYPKLPKQALNTITGTLIRQRQREIMYRRRESIVTTEAEIRIINQKMLKATRAGRVKDQVLPQNL